MAKDVFSSKEFKAYAQRNLVLVEVDFPHAKPQSEAQKKANAALSEKFSVEGFPTLVILSSRGKELDREVGYDGSGPKPLIEKLRSLQKKNI